MPHGKGGSWIWPPTRWAIYGRDRFRCVYCHRRVRGGTSPRHRFGGSGGTLPWGAGWRSGARGVADADQVACIDHPYPGCPVDQCVTACWTCNSSLQDGPRPVLPGRTLTPRDREIGRRLWRIYCAQRERALAAQR